MSELYPIHSIRSVEGATQWQGKPQEELMSQELKRLVQELKEVTNSLVLWIRHSILSPRRNSLQASLEIMRISKALQSIRTELLAYAQQIPEPHDGPIALNLLQLMEQFFCFQLSEIIPCQFPDHGKGSFSSFLLKNVFWTESMVLSLCRKVTMDEWVEALDLLDSFSNAIASE